MLIRRFLCGAVGGVVPGVVPAIVVTGLDAGRGGQDFAELRTAIFCGSESALGLVPELNVVWEQRLLVHRRGANGAAPDGVSSTRAPPAAMVASGIPSAKSALRFIDDPLKRVTSAGGPLIPIFAKTFAETGCEC